MAALGGGFGLDVVGPDAIDALGLFLDDEPDDLIALQALQQPHHPCQPLLEPSDGNSSSGSEGLATPPPPPAQPSAVQALTSGPWPLFPLLPDSPVPEDLVELEPVPLPPPAPAASMTMAAMLASYDDPTSDDALGAVDAHVLELITSESLPAPDATTLSTATTATTTSSATASTATKRSMTTTRPSTKSQSGTTKPKTKRPPNYNSNKARDERRREIRCLRQQVAELEQELGVLHVRRGPGGDPNAGTVTIRGGGDGNSSCTALKRKLPGAWEEIAAHQLDERLRSERENARLKASLEKQVRVTKRLFTLINTSISAGLEDEDSLPPHPEALDPDHSSSPRPGDPKFFRHLIELVEKCYREVDAQFERVGILSLEVTFQDGRIREGDKGMSLEIFGNKVLPFTLHETSDAVWEHFTKCIKTLPTRHYRFKNSYSDTATSEETVFETLQMLIFAKDGTKTDIWVKQVFRRYRDRDRVVIVWSGTVEPLEFADQPVSGLRFHESGYVLLQRPTTMDPLANTVLKTCFVLTPELTPDSICATDDKLLRQMAEFFISSTSACIASSFQMIESALADRAAGGTLPCLTACAS